MGLDFPPYYGIKSISSIDKEIAKVDAKISTLLVEREHLVEKRNEALKKEDSTEA